MNRLAFGVLHASALLLLGATPAAALTAPVAACRFSPATFEFAGAPLDQARCLLRPITRRGEQGPELAALPPALAGRVGQPFTLDLNAVQRVLQSDGLPAALLDASRGISHGGGDLNLAARYFVIHDTSTPNLRNGKFPDALDADERINSFNWYRTDDPPGHAFVNRGGEIFVGHDFSEPLRETKLEDSGAVGVLNARGLFIHVELVQPRRDDPAFARRHNGAIAPEPGFTPVQYHRLAQLYVIASARAGTWLVPGFHANIDRWFHDAHDDPQNFSLTDFDAALDAVVESIAAG